MPSTPQPEGCHRAPAALSGGEGPAAGRLAQELIDTFGVTLVAALAASTTSKAPDGWATGVAEVPEAALSRLRAARDAWALVAGVDGDDVARAWFVGKNPFLTQTPVLALREGRLDDVLNAARAYASGTWSA